ncbi:MAG: CBS domain-containing protein [bacterium]|nr:CBS domain-containing protein [bacterium]
MTIHVRDAMQTDVQTVHGDLALSEFEERSIEHHVSGFPVVDDGKLMGVVSRSDIVRTLTVERTYDDQLSDYYGGPTPLQPSEVAKGVLDAGARIGARLSKFTVKDAMCRNVVTADPEQTIEDVAKLMLARGVHRLPVTEDGILVGIITTLDLARLVAEGRLTER